MLISAISFSEIFFVRSTVILSLTELEIKQFFSTICDLAENVESYDLQKKRCLCSLKIAGLPAIGRILISEDLLF